MDPTIDFQIHGTQPIQTISRWENSFVLSYGTSLQAYSLFQYSTIQDITSWMGVQPNVYEFFKLKKHFSNFGKQTNVLFYENFSLAETQMQIKRTVYDIWAMTAYLGGICFSFIVLGDVFIKPFA